MINHTFSLKDGGHSNYESTIELPRHRWYYYKEGFAPSLVKAAIEQARVQPDDLVIDPFNGSGTTTVTASTLGYQSWGIEVNPFTAFLANTKCLDADNSKLQAAGDIVLKGCETGAVSSLKGFSTFSAKEGLEKWLFEDEVLDAFEGGWQTLSKIRDNSLQDLIKLVLVSAAMKNCNATRDGKCLRYRKSWESYGFNRATFLASYQLLLKTVIDDISSSPVRAAVEISGGDCRKILARPHEGKFKLCITSPPYLNTFDYTDIYRPELFLGKFVDSKQGLRDLRFETVRSHVQVSWKSPTQLDFGALFAESLAYLQENDAALMDRRIPLMVQAYFEDMRNVIRQLFQHADAHAQLWLVVSNSAYANREVPVDLILADIGSKVGWSLVEVGVMRNIRKRRTIHSPDVDELRESVVIFSKR